AAGAGSTARPLFAPRRWGRGGARASWGGARRLAHSSGADDFKNLSRAGGVEKRSRTPTLGPESAGTSSPRLTVPPPPARRSPCEAPRGQLVSVKRETAQIAASASPRNPSVAIASRSSSRASFEVA